MFFLIATLTFISSIAQVTYSMDQSCATLLLDSSKVFREKIGPYPITVTYTGEGPTEAIEIQYEHFHNLWRKYFWDDRLMPFSDPLGARPEFWNIEIPKEATTEERKMLTEERFRSTVNLKDIRGIINVVDLMDDIPFTYFYKTHLRNYFDRHKSELKKLFQDEIDRADPAKRASLDFKLKPYVLAITGESDVFFGTKLQFNSPALPTAYRRDNAKIPNFAEHPLLVIHASSAFDEKGVAKDDINSLLTRWTALNRPTVFLIEPNSAEDRDWYARSAQPTYVADSAGGEHNIKVIGNDVTVIGGFFGDYEELQGCHFKGMVDVITRHFLESDSPFNVHMPIPAIYFYRDDGIDRNKFMSKKVSDKDMIERIHESYFFTDSDPNIMGFNYRYTGEVSLNDYTFNYYVNDKLISSRGTGAKQVNLRFYRQMADFKI